MQQNEQAVAFALDQIRALFSLYLICNHGLDELFGVRVDDEEIERFDVPLNVFDELDVECNCTCN